MKHLLFSFWVLANVFTLAAFEEQGIASWYGGQFQGRLTANGETFNTYEVSAAHKTLPFGTIVTVENMENGKKLKVRINDRGPYIDGRVIDLSYAAARELGILNQGIAQVRITADSEVTTLMNFATIQVGAFRNIAYAKKLKDMLTDAGFTPYAIMTSSGIVRIELKNVLKKDAEATVKQLRALGVENPLIRT